MKKCIIYDCDGVLVDSEILAGQVDSEFLTSLGYKITVEECIKLFLGKSPEIIKKVVFENSGIKLLDPQLKEIHNAIFLKFDTYLKPLINSGLEKLKKKNWHQCVASGSNLNWVFYALKVTHLLKYFNSNTIFSAQHVSKGKPAPDLFLWAAKNMRQEPKNCIVIEDSPSGIEAALAANMTVIGYTRGSHTQYEWYQNKIKSYNVPTANT